MPELPEVEIVARSLAEAVKGKKIVSAQLHRKLLAPALSPARFSRQIGGTIITGIGRRGKHILVGLSEDLTLIVHLRMSGRFILISPGEENPRFTHAEFHFENEERLIFEDQRHFGYMNLVETAKLNEAKELCKLAPEPLSDSFSLDYLKKTLRSTARPLKDVLLDQTRVCGLGNIYAAESMFLARLHPAVPSNRVSAIKARRLHMSIREVLSESIESGLRKRLDPGNIENRYFNGSSASGWLVYDRENAPCDRCGTPVRRMRQSGRSSYFCPRCQRK